MPKETPDILAGFSKAELLKAGIFALVVRDRTGLGLDVSLPEIKEFVNQIGNDSLMATLDLCVDIRKEFDTVGETPKLRQLESQKKQITEEIIDRIIGTASVQASPEELEQQLSIHRLLDSINFAAQSLASFLATLEE